MSARHELFLRITETGRLKASGANELLDTHRAEVLAEAKVEVVAWLVKKAREEKSWDASVLASKVDRGAVRIFLGLGHYRDAMDEHRTEVLAADGQAYDGELAMARGLLRTLRAVVRDDTSAEKQRAEVRQLLHEHASDEAAARAGEKATAAAATATPTFFEPGHVYTRQHHGRTIEFRVTAIDTSPDGEQRLARGWRTDEYSDWESTDSDDLTGWTDVTQTEGR